MLAHTLHLPVLATYALVFVVNIAATMWQRFNFHRNAWRYYQQRNFKAGLEMGIKPSYGMNFREYMLDRMSRILYGALYLEHLDEEEANAHSL